MTAIPSRPIGQVLKAHTPDLMKIPGVVGTAQGLLGETPCIVIMVASRTPEVDSSIPDRLEGHPVDIRVTGELEAR